MRVATLLALLLATGVRASDEGDAAADAARLPPEVAYRTRYLALDRSTAPRDAKGRDKYLRILAFHVNSLSRYAAFGVVRQVSASVLAIDVGDYGPHWHKLFEKLADFDPYGHGKVRETAIKFATTTKQVLIKEWKGGEYRAPDGKRYDLPLPVPPGGYLIEYTVTEEVSRERGKPKQAIIPEDPKAMADLVRLTQSQVPILRADWFIVQTQRELDRDEVKTGAGYYEFLDVKDLAGIDALAGVHREESKRLQAEVAAVVDESGVAINNRQILWQGAVGGSLIETYDTDSNKGAQNAKRQKGDDFFKAAQAREIYAPLPNGLFATFAVNSQDGTLQDFVPEKFAPRHGKTQFADPRIHPGLSCIACHEEGLRPINDWSRQFYKTNELKAVDHELFKRLQNLYLGPLDERIAASNLVYASAVKRLTGLSTKAVAEGYADVWIRYVDTRVTRSQLAFELGVSEERMQAAFFAYNKATGLLDETMAGYLGKEEMPARREHIEESWPLMVAAVRGFVLP